MNRLWLLSRSEGTVACFEENPEAISISRSKPEKCTLPGRAIEVLEQQYATPTLFQEARCFRRYPNPSGSNDDLHYFSPAFPAAESSYLASLPLCYYEGT